MHGRFAHEGHVNRTNQAWKADSVQVFVQDPMTKQHLIFDMPRGNKTCPKCHEVIRYDARGYAFCQCLVHNDMIYKSPRELENKERKWVTKHFLKRITL